MSSPVRVEPVRSRADARAFLHLPYRLHRSDPHWVPPLRAVERGRWSLRRNASLARLRTERLLARRGGRVVGRVAAIVDPLFTERWAAGGGFFGFFECEDDPGVAGALLSAAEERLRAWGCGLVLGPVNHTTHEEVGLLVEGFGRRPSFLSPYNPPAYPRLVEAAGYRTEREYRAWEWTPAAPPSRAARRLARRWERGDSEVRIRSLDPRRFDAEMRLLHRLYNSCFRDLWGFVETSWEEFRERAEAFRPFYRPETILLAEEAGREGEAIGFAVVLPDVNEALAGLGGRLLPWGWLRLLRGIRRIRSGRFILMGVLEEQRGRGVAPLLALAMREAVTAAGLERVEVSLVQADNASMVRVVEALGCEPARTFRLYSKEL